MPASHREDAAVSARGFLMMHAAQPTDLAIEDQTLAETQRALAVARADLSHARLAALEVQRALHQVALRRRNETLPVLDPSLVDAAVAALTTGIRDLVPLGGEVTVLERQFQVLAVDEMTLETMGALVSVTLSAQQVHRKLGALAGELRRHLMTLVKILNINDRALANQSIS